MTGIIEAWEGATLTVSRVDAGLGRCGQVVAAIQVVEAGSFVEESSFPFPILVLGMIAFIGHW